MDSLSLNIRSSTEPSALPDKRSSPEPKPVADQGAGNAPISLAVDTGKVTDILRKSPKDDSKSPPDLSVDIEKALSNANHFFEQVSRELRFQRSETEDKRVVVQVTDQKTGELIRQFPSEQMIQISNDLERISGLLFKDSA